MTLYRDMRKLTWLTGVLIIFLTGCVGAATVTQAKRIQLHLATVPHLSRRAVELSQQFSRAYPYVDFALSIMPPQEAFKAVSQRQVDVALISGPVDPQWQDLEAVQIDRQAIVVAVHPSNTLDKVTWEQLREIFAGRVWDWGYLIPETASREILVVSQHQGAFSRSTFERYVMRGEPVTPRARVAYGDAVAAQLIAQQPAAIGYLSATVVDENIKVLSIDGTTPNASAVASGAWPLSHAINLVTRVDAGVYVLDFVDFCKMRLKPIPFK